MEMKKLCPSCGLNDWKEVNGHLHCKCGMVYNSTEFYAEWGHLIKEFGTVEADSQCICSKCGVTCACPMGKTCKDTPCPTCGGKMHVKHMSKEDEETEVKKTHGPGHKSWGPKTEACILKWEKDHPGDPKSKMVAICRSMHKDQ